MCAYVSVCEYKCVYLCVCLSLSQRIFITNHNKSCILKLVQLFCSCDVMIADVQLLSDETKWKSICSLGKGGFGEVFQYKHIKTGILIAVKVIKFDPNKDDVNYKRKSLQNEISIYTEFSKKCSVQNTEIENYGQRIVEYFGSVDDAINCTVSICLEFMQKGSLQEHLKNNGPLAESETRKYTRQLLEGLCYLHDVRSIVHRDIKAANLLITNSYDIKLADFGLSKSIDSSTHGAETQGVGTYNWMPPEVVNGDKYGFKADIWSTGCTVVEMLTTKPPWSGLRNVKIITKLAAGDYPIYTITSSSEDLQEFLKMCFRKEHRERPSAEDLLKTNFISNNN